jgi:hypothetical protein
MKNKILIDKINNEKTLNVYMFIFLNLLITTPFLIAVYYSRCENIFNLNDHSYVEHFLTYFFGLPFLMALLLIIGKLITSIIFLFAKGEIYPIYINTLNTVLFGFCVFVILVTELNRDGINLINHTFFDLFSLLISYIIIYIAFKNYTIR